MMSQILFLFSLYFLGLLFGLCLIKKLPLWFILSSAVFWGALNWVIISIPIVWLNDAFSFNLSTLIVVLEGLACLVYLFVHRPFKFKSKIFVLICVHFIGMLIATILFSKFNIATTTKDSLFLIRMAQDLALTGYSSFPLAAPNSYGIFVSMLQAASSSLGIDYLFGFQPFLSLNFVMLFFFACLNTGMEIRRGWGKLVFALLAVIFLFSSQIMRFEFTLIHTNLNTGIYLFLSLLSLVHYDQTHEPAWLGCSITALLGFSLIRTETVIFSLIIIGLSLAIYKIDYSLRIRIYLPYFFFMILWLFAMYLMNANPFNIMMNRSLLILTIAALFTASLLIIISKIPWIDQKILPFLRFIIPGGLVLGNLVGLILKTDTFIAGIESTISKLLLTGAWDTCWVAVFFLIPFLIFHRTIGKLDRTDLFLLLVIPCYFLFILFANFPHPNIETRWSSSDNRMFVHILPLAVYEIIHLLKASLLAENKT